MFNFNNVILSIVVPVYNCEKYVGRCIQSLIDLLKNIKI